MITGFFHIFGMGCNAHHGKLHESVDQVHKLLLRDTPIHNLRAQRYYESLQFVNCGMTRDYVF